MVLSKREKYITICTAAVLALLVLDRFALTGILDKFEQTRLQKEKLQKELDDALGLLELEGTYQQIWRNYTDQGVRSDVSETESRVLHEVRNWSRQCGLNLSSIKPDRVTSGQNMREVTFLYSGTGNMSSLGQFLYQLEHTTLPLRLKDIQISSRQEAADDMSLQVRFSAIHFSPDTETSAPGGQIARAGGGGT